MEKEERKLMLDGDPKPDIVKESKTLLIVLAMFVCAILVVIAVCGAFFLLNWLVKSLC